MDDGIKNLKEEYNELLSRHYQAAVYFDDPNVSLEDKLYYQPQYAMVLNRLSGILNELSEKGIRYINDEVLGGFCTEKRKNRKRNNEDKQDG